MLKFIVRAIGVVAIIAAVLIAANWTKIKRLNTVNTLFDADKIVQNFSNMDAAFLHQDLEASETPFIWPEAPQALPETVTIAGNERNLPKLLETLDTTAFIVIKDGKILNENYYLGTDRDDRRISWSMAKSFMSGLYGSALESGQIKSLDDKVEVYVPSLKGSAYEGTTLRNVLNMASGVKYNEDYMDPDSDINDMGRVLGLGGSMDEYAAGLTAKRGEAGADWQYVSIDTHVAAMVLRAATGKSLHELFNETYSANLGFEKAPFYLTDGENVAFALGGLNLTTRDYAKFGQLFLDGGKFNGKQVVPADWAAASTVHSAPTIGDRGAGYGYQWWVPMPQEGANKGDFFAVGIYGQYIYINPAKNIVIAKNAADREFTQNMEGYGHSMNVNVDMFRSLADYYGESEFSRRYFSLKHFSSRYHRGRFSKWLSEWDEPPLKEMGAESGEIYRFAVLPSFSNSTLIRVTKDKTGRAWLFKRSRDRIRGTDTDEEFKLSEAQFEHVKLEFANVETCKAGRKWEPGLDGTTWLFESNVNSEHCAFDVWEPAKDSVYTNLGNLLIGLRPESK